MSFYAYFDAYMSKFPDFSSSGHENRVLMRHRSELSNLMAQQWPVLKNTTSMNARSNCGRPTKFYAHVDAYTSKSPIFYSSGHESRVLMEVQIRTFELDGASTEEYNFTRTKHRSYRRKMCIHDALFRFPRSR
jgi:hypothetical protein